MRHFCRKRPEQGARFAVEKTGLPAIADDAGLCVDAFGGLPGVDTAYYCTHYGYEKSDDNNVTCLLENLAPHANRKAAMVSTLVGVRSPKDPEPLDCRGPRERRNWPQSAVAAMALALTPC